MTSSPDSVDTPRPTVLLVDDTPYNLELLSGLLMDRVKLRVASSGARALEIARGLPQPNLMLLDIMMPEMDGYEVCRRLKADLATRHIPIIFLTSKDQVEDERMGLELGAADYLTKPFSPAILIARVETQLKLKAAADFLRDRNAFLEAEVQRRTGEIVAIRDVLIQSMASLAETRDNETGNHILRTRSYIRLLANRLASHPRYAPWLAPDRIEILCKCAPLHDIGKIGIPDSVLRKPGKLSPEEFEIMKTHATIGRDTILSAEKMLGIPDPFLQCAREIAGSHHEHWDGTGYPEGLVGEAIPIAARLMTLADVYDALISRRIYKDSMPHEVARDAIVARSGTMFDPIVVEAFLACEDAFLQAAMQYADMPA